MDLLTAPLVVFDYFENTMVMLGWVIHNALWGVMNQSGITAIPFIALIVSEWFRARQEGDDEGNKGILTINRIESRLYAMVIAFAFTCQPVLELQISTVDVDHQRSQECGTRQFASGQWGESTLNSLDGQTPRIPLWWGTVHAVSHGITSAAIAAIPCSTDFHSIRTELDLHAIKDPGLQREVGEFQLACFGHARNKLFQQGGRIEASLARDVDWVGSRYFLETPGFYDSFYAGRPIPGFPYDEQRDMSRPNTGPGQPGYPTCREWWAAEESGLRARLHDQIDPGFWDDFRSVFTSTEAEDYVIRRMVSPRSGAANGNLDQAVVGYRNLDGGTVGQAVTSAAGAVGGALAMFPFAAGMDMLKQALPMVQSILVMAVIVCLPFVMVISSYSFKAAGVATFGLFAIWFLTFWWEVARWLNSNLVDLLYHSDAAKMSFLAAVNNTYDKMVLQFVEGMTFLILPGIWITVLGWAGMKVGDSLGRSIGESSRPAQGAGEQGGKKSQSGASGGKL
ncbi:hypothetical protein L861_06700 [Litchfieldella anticariensis FP35 = DSM 16096]|uniref:TraG N-terminal Proteobacteria domain-containing protein n=2 Tax=Litchfieldella anticariensis TaxID=258591 RepID=S2KYY7_LITA3|nr:hypothetical protein L861_06700 [Halomonas anticariensis FP35 = DSM 16096]